MESITLEKVKDLVNVLADDSFEGRETGSRGGRAAGSYLGEQFQKLNLQGAGAKGGYYQVFGSGSRNILGLARRQRSGVEKRIRVGDGPLRPRRLRPKLE